MSDQPSLSALDDAQLSAIVERIFRERRATLQGEGVAIGSEQLAVTIQALRAKMRSTVAVLPSSAFVPPDDPPPGEAGRTAGQIVSHNADRLLWALIHADETLGGGLVAEPPPELAAGAAEPPLLLDRDTALAVLTAADQYLDTALPALIRTDDGRVASATHHGAMGLPGWLMLIAIHDHDHLGQLLARVAQSRTL